MSAPDVRGLIFVALELMLFFDSLVQIRVLLLLTLVVLKFQVIDVPDVAAPCSCSSLSLIALATAGSP